LQPRKQVSESTLIYWGKMQTDHMHILEKGQHNKFTVLETRFLRGWGVQTNQNTSLHTRLRIPVFLSANFFKEISHKSIQNLTYSFTNVPQGSSKFLHINNQIGNVARKAASLATADQRQLTFGQL